MKIILSLGNVVVQKKKDIKNLYFKMSVLLFYKIKVDMEILVENIKCNGCATSIKNGLLKLKGVKEVDIEIENGIVKLGGDAEDMDQSEIVNKLQSMGYPEPGKGSGLTTATSFVSCMIGRVTS